MPRYSVTICETITNQEEIEASSPEEAAGMAEEPWTCHHCPEVSGAPYAIVYDEDGNEVLDESFAGSLRKRLDTALQDASDADLVAEVVRRFGEHAGDELRAHMAKGGSDA